MDNSKDSEILAEILNRLAVLEAVIERLTEQKKPGPSPDSGGGVPPPPPRK